MDARARLVLSGLREPLPLPVTLFLRASRSVGGRPAGGRAVAEGRPAETSPGPAEMSTLARRRRRQAHARDACHHGVSREHVAVTEAKGDGRACHDS